jgi:tetratricopeptide (TPR) repeat protein
MEDQKKDFFISYTAKDRKWAEWIAWQLEEAGYSVVVQAWDFRPGGNFALDMQKATDAERTIAVLSPDYLQKPFPQAITGLGGLGKTQLAVEYAYRHADDYDVVWWVRSDEPVTMATDFAGLGSELTPPVEMVTDLDRNVEAVKRRLERMSRQEARWLVIFDNATDSASAGKLLPRNSNGHILITSRDQNWRGVAHPLPLELLPREDSIKFLTERIGRTAPSDREAANHLAQELGDLPLALEQAGAYIDAISKPIDDYLRLFRAKRREMIARGAPVTGYEATIATTWDISFQSLRSESPAAADLLNLFAFFAPDAIRREWIVSGAGHLPETLAGAVNDELAFDDIAAAFRRYSLVEVNAERNSFTVHRLVQTVMRERMTDEERVKWAEAALRVVNDKFPVVDFYQRPETWPLCNELLAHARALTELAESLDVAKEQTLFERALKINEAAFGSDHPSVAICLNNLGLLLQELGDLAQARALFELALKIDEAAFGPDHPSVATGLNNLAGALQDLGDLAQADALLERALSICRKFLGDDHPNTQLVRRNLERPTEKMNRVRRNLEAILRKFLGGDHPNTQFLRKNIERLIEKMNRE